MQVVSRRQFLASLLLFGLTPPRFWLAVRIAAICGVVALVLSFVRSIGFENSAHIAVGAVLLFAALCGIGAALAWIGSLARRLPVFLSALLATLFELLGIVLVMSSGVYLYRRWETGDDLAEPIIALTGYYAKRLIDEYDRKATAKRSASQQPP